MKPQPAPPDPLRDALAGAVRRLGIVRVAGDAGVAHQTLRKYLAAGRVRTGTREKLERWARQEDAAS